MAKRRGVRVQPRPCRPGPGHQGRRKAVCYNGLAMWLQRLSLTNYRNYVRLELSLPPGLSIIQGQNAQGKSNLLEAIAYLATSRSPRTNSDAELVNWLALEEPFPYARLAADLKRAGRLEQVDITLLPATGNGGFRKQVRINGVARRALDLVGLLLVVLFRPEDVDLIAGAPAGRRRYLDIALCQIDPVYCRALSEYNKGLEQRNALLRSLRPGAEAVAQLRFWDEKLAETGGLIMARRQWLINALEKAAALHHLDLSGGYERLRLRYLPSFDPGHAPARSALPAVAATGVRYDDLTPEGAGHVFLAWLHQNRGRDLAAGMTLLGPHRDDLGFYLGERPLRHFGSRGQQRTAALAAKLAELTIMTEVTGTTPVLLLDDVMSELDGDRRAMLLQVLTTAAQAVITTTDWHPFSPTVLAQAQTWRVHGGQLEAVEPLYPETAS
jgi:DNA replication and repair protein RecF